MATLKEYFEREAGEYLQRLRDLLPGVADAFASGEVHRVARALRGTAQMAREAHVQAVAGVVERASKPGGARSDAPADLGQRLEATLDILSALVDPARDRDGDEGLARDITHRWSDMAAPPPQAAGREAGAGPSRAFMAYAAREANAIADELERGVAAFIANPVDREILKRILRQQRALLGAAKLEDLPIVAETLRAVEELARVIAKLDAPVKGEWLDVFRTARDIMHIAAPALAAGEQPPQLTALSRLRTLRDEILDRYGAGEAISIAPGDRLQAPSAVVATPPTSAGEGQEPDADAQQWAELPARDPAGGVHESADEATGPQADELSEQLAPSIGSTPPETGKPTEVTAEEDAATAGIPTLDPGGEEAVAESHPPAGATAEVSSSPGSEAALSAGVAASADKSAPVTVAPTESPAALGRHVPQAGARPTAAPGNVTGAAAAGTGARAAARAATPEPGPDDVVDIRSLCYRGDAALQRALKLRASLEAAVRGHPGARELVAEIFDLIELGRE